MHRIIVRLSREGSFYPARMRKGVKQSSLSLLPRAHAQEVKCSVVSVVSTKTAGSGDLGI